MIRSRTLREEFLKVVAWFMAAMAGLAWLLSEISGTKPLTMLNPSWQNVGIGLAVAVVMSSLFRLARRERRLAEEAIGPYLAQCHWYDFIWLAAVVGFCEEWLFRGVLELWLAPWGEITALLLVNLLFGLLHALSWRYALLAGVMGAVFSLLVKYPGEESLLRPMVAHAVYDWIGFMIIAGDARRHAREREMPSAAVEET